MVEKPDQRNDESPDAAEVWSDSEPANQARVVKPGGLHGGVVVEMLEEMEPRQRSLEIGLKIEARPVRESGGTKGPALEVSEIGGGNYHRLEAEEVPVIPLFPRVENKFKPRETHGKSTPEWQVPDWHAPPVKSQPRSQRWMLHWGAIIVGVIALSFAVHYFVSIRDSAQGLSPYGKLSLAADEYDAIKPSAFFDQHPEWARQRTLAAFHDYRNAKTYQEALPFMRKPAKPNGEMQREWQPWGGEPVGELTCASNSVGELPFVVLSGTRADQSEFTAYFVRDGETMKFDWEATYEAGDIRVAELAAAGTVSNALVRCVASICSYYTIVFPEDRYRCYRLSSGDGQSYAWGYAERGSREEGIMSEQLHENPILLDKEDQQKITLRLTRGPAGAAANQFVITGILHNEWVNP